jgi:hypothetical protein
MKAAIDASTRVTDERRYDERREAGKKLGETYARRRDKSTDWRPKSAAAVRAIWIFGLTAPAARDPR